MTKVVDDCEVAATSASHMHIEQTTAVDQEGKDFCAKYSAVLPAAETMDISKCRWMFDGSPPPWRSWYISLSPQFASLQPLSCRRRILSQSFVAHGIFRR